MSLGFHSQSERERYATEMTTLDYMLVSNVKHVMITRPDEVDLFWGNSVDADRKNMLRYLRPQILISS